MVSIMDEKDKEIQELRRRNASLAEELDAKDKCIDYLLKLNKGYEKTIQAFIDGTNELLDKASKELKATYADV